MGNKTSKKYNISPLDNISDEKNENKNLGNNNDGGEVNHTLIEKEINNDPLKIEQMKQQLNSNNLNNNINNFLKSSTAENDTKIVNYSNENELRQEYKIEINKYHHKVNNRKVKIPTKSKNYISTSKYTWYNFAPKILYEQFTKMSNIYFIIIAILQCFPEISNANGKPIILMPLCIVVIVNSMKDFYEDWKRKKSDDEENNRKVEVYDLDMEKFIIKKWKDVFVGNIIKVKKGEYFPADCVLISSTDRKTHGCYIETKNLDGETNLKMKKSVVKFVNRCRKLNTFQGKFITQLPNEFIYQFSGVFEFDYNDNFHSLSNNNQKHIDENEKIKENGHLNDLISGEIEEKLDNEPKDDIKDEENNIGNDNNVNINSIKKSFKSEKIDIDLETEYEGNLSEHTYYTRRKNSEEDCSFTTFSNSNEDKTVIVDNSNFLLRGCSLRQTESVLCFVVYAGKNTKIMQNSPGARAKTSSVEKRMNRQIKFIFFLQILLGLLASIFSLSQIISLGKDPAPYIYKDKNDRPFDFEEYASKFNRIISNENFNKIFGKNNESLFSMLKNFFQEIAPLFGWDVISFLLIKLGTWCVLLNNLVPISLLMTLELVKYFQGFFISWDIDIYDKRQKVTTKVQTSTLNEELGQIKYIFSDKTGTLTKNFMTFKKVSIGLKQYNENKENSLEDDVIENNISDFGSEINLDKEDNLTQNKTNFENINKKKIKKRKKEKYKDEYGKIRHVSFDDDTELIKDLEIIPLLDEKNINNENNNIENKKEKIINNNERDINNEDDIQTDLIDRDSHVFNEELSKGNIKKIKEEKDENELENNPEVNQKEILDLFMTALATCHSGMIDEKEFNLNKKLLYQASSPDEVAILNFARKYKYIFLGRKDNNKIIIKKPVNSELTEIIFKIPFQFEYSSERKSMSVILQNISNPEEIYLFMKGADNVILNRLAKNNKVNKVVIKNLKNALDTYAKEGLRILAVAYKKLTLEEMSKYQKEFYKASKSTYNKKEKIEQLSKFVETDLIILGVTAIEDELQDDVNETLKDFSEAGIKLWVLTGDKKDTAKSIAYSCGLFDDENFNIFEINEGLNKIQLEARLNELVEQFNNLVDKMDMGKSKKIKFLSSSKMDLGNNNNQNVDNNNQNNNNNNINNINSNIEKNKTNANNLADDKKENSEKIGNIKDEPGKKEEEGNSSNIGKEKEQKNINNDDNEIKNEELIDEDININENNNKNNKKEDNNKSTNKDNINIHNNVNDNNNKEHQNNNNEVLNEKSDNNNIKPKFALVISSDELNILSLNYELEILFYELSSRCNSVLCCRVSPIQKAKMVHLIQRFTKLQEKKGSNYYKYLSEKQNEYNNNTQLIENRRDRDNKPMSPLKDSVITLAIGDGANDVNMITSAHVGVGIIGVEGKQAARASDYAIGQFKFLKKILFYHGHESLRRNTYIIYYNFYKNFLFVMPQFYVGFYSLFSGQSIYDPWLYQLFNILFSVLPILWFGIYDSERTTTMAMNNAKFYTSINQQLYNNWNFWRWIIRGIIQGFFIFLFVFSSNNIYANNNSGEIQDFKSSGMMTYSLVVIIVNLKVLQLTSVHGVVSLFFLFFSIGSYYILTFLMSNEPSMFYFGVFWRMIKNIRYFFILGLLCIGLTFISVGFVFLSKICYKNEINTKHDKIMYKYYKKLENDKRMKKNKKKKDKKKNKINNKKTQKELIEDDNAEQ